MTLDLTDTIIYTLHFLSKQEAVSAASAFQDRAVFVTTPVKVRKEWRISAYMRSTTGRVEQPTTAYIKQITEANGGYIKGWGAHVPL